MCVEVSTHASVRMCARSPCSCCWHGMYLCMRGLCKPGTQPPSTALARVPKPYPLCARLPVALRHRS